jgi:hypothetical protein
MKYLLSLTSLILMAFMVGCGSKDEPTIDDFITEDSPDVEYAAPHSNGPTGLPEVIGPDSAPPPL